MKFSSKRQLLLALTYFCKKSLSQMVDRVPNTSIFTTHYKKKLRFSLRISSVNVTKSAGILNEKLHFLCSDVTLGCLEFKCRIGYLSSENF